MTPQKESIILDTSRPYRYALSAYTACTLTLECSGDVSEFTTLKAEIHATTNVGVTPLAESIYDGTPGAGPHDLPFTAAKMNLLANNVRTKRLVLVVLGQSGSGDARVKSVLAFIDLTLLAAPGGNTIPNPPPVSTYASDEDLAALDERVTTLEGAAPSLVEHTGYAAITIGGTTIYVPVLAI